MAPGEKCWGVTKFPGGGVRGCRIRKKGTGSAGERRPQGEQGAPAGRFTLQAGAMKNRETAEAVRRRLEVAGYPAKIAHGTDRNGGEVYRVRVGPYESREAAARAMKAIKERMKIDVILLKG